VLLQLLPASEVDCELSSTELGTVQFLYSGRRLSRRHFNKGVVVQDLDLADVLPGDTIDRGEQSYQITCVDAFAPADTDENARFVRILSSSSGVTSASTGPGATASSCVLQQIRRDVGAVEDRCVLFDESLVLSEFYRVLILMDCPHDFLDTVLHRVFVKRQLSHIRLLLVLDFGRWSQAGHHMRVAQEVGVLLSSIRSREYCRVRLSFHLRVDESNISRVLCTLPQIRGRICGHENTAGYPRNVDIVPANVIYESLRSRYNNVGVARHRAFFSARVRSRREPDHPELSRFTQAICEHLLNIPDIVRAAHKYERLNARTIRSDTAQCR
jgi:hypothetical protein